jgi:hypothetical protein
MASPRHISPGEVYLEIVEELTSRHTPAGAHLLRFRDRTVALFMQYHTTPLRKYNAHGIRLDLLRWAQAHGATEIHFENLLTGKFYVTPLDRVLTDGIRDNLGGKGVRYYLSLDEWQKTTRWYEMPWTNNVETLPPMQGNLF